MNKRLSIPVPICFQKGLKGLKSQRATFETLIVTGHSLFKAAFMLEKAIEIVVLAAFSSQRSVEVLCYLLRCYFVNGCVGLCLIKNRMVFRTYWTKTR